MLGQQVDRTILLPDGQTSGDHFWGGISVLARQRQMSAEHHDHLVDHQTRELKRTIRERQHHSRPMKDHVISGPRSAVQVANPRLPVLVTESVENEPRYVY